MENNQEIIKARVYQAKAELEQKEYNHKSIDGNCNIKLQYSCILKQILYKGENLEDDLIKEINIAINEVKIKMSEEYIAILAGMGIKM